MELDRYTPILVLTMGVSLALLSYTKQSLTLAPVALVTAIYGLWLAVVEFELIDHL